MNIRSIIALQEIVTRFVIGKILMDAMYKRLAIQGSVLFCVSVAISSKPVNFGCRCKVS